MANMMTLGTVAVSLAEANQCLFLVFPLHKGRPRSSVIWTHYLSHSILLEWLIISYNRPMKLNSTYIISGFYYY